MAYQAPYQSSQPSGPQPSSAYMKEARKKYTAGKEPAKDGTSKTNSVVQFIIDHLGWISCGHLGRPEPPGDDKYGLITTNVNPFRIQVCCKIWEVGVRLEKGSGRSHLLRRTKRHSLGRSKPDAARLSARSATPPLSARETVSPNVSALSTQPASSRSQKITASGTYATRWASGFFPSKCFASAARTTAWLPSPSDRKSCGSRPWPSANLVRASRPCKRLVTRPASLNRPSTQTRRGSPRRSLKASLGTTTRRRRLPTLPQPPPIDAAEAHNFAWR